jgi:hypothetical protein
MNHFRIQWSLSTFNQLFPIQWALYHSIKPFTFLILCFAFSNEAVMNHSFYFHFYVFVFVVDECKSKCFLILCFAFQMRPWWIALFTFMSLFLQLTNVRVNVLLFFSFFWSCVLLFQMRPYRITVFTFTVAFMFLFLQLTNVRVNAFLFSWSCVLVFKWGPDE